MESFHHIGVGKAFRFLWTSLYIQVLHICVIPQVRAALLRLAGASIGTDTVIMNADFTNAYHYGFSRLYIGNKVFIGDGVMLDLRGGIHMHDEVTVSNRSCIVTHINVGYSTHPLQKKYPSKEAEVILHAGSYVGTAAVLLPGVIVGREAVVGAGAVVTKDVSSRSVVVGVPAKIIKSIR